MFEKVVRVLRCPLAGKQGVGGPLCFLQGSSLVHAVERQLVCCHPVVFMVCRRPEESKLAMAFRRRVCLSLVLRRSSRVCNAVWRARWFYAGICQVFMATLSCLLCKYIYCILMKGVYFPDKSRYLLCLRQCGGRVGSVRWELACIYSSNGIATCLRMPRYQRLQGEVKF